MRWSYCVVLALFTTARCLTAQVDSFAARAVIRGIVRDTLGRPYPRIVVNLSRLSVDVSTIGDTTRSWLTIWTDTTDDDGRFEFPPIQPRTYMVIFSKDFFVHGDTTVEIKQPTDTMSVELRSQVRRPLYETPDSVRTRRLAELAKARAKWEAHRSRSYQYAAHIECFCLMAIEGKTTLEFRNDSLVRGTTQHGRLGPDALPWFKSFSVPLLFSAVEEAIRSRERRVDAIEYDATYGFPTWLDTDTAYGFTDGWYRWRITDFRPTP